MFYPHETSQQVSLVINAPELFAREDFRTWLNAPNRLTFSWHQSGDPTEYSDVVVLLDPGLTGEGSDDDMPGWNELCAFVRTKLAPRPGMHIPVRLTNLR